MRPKSKGVWEIRYTFNGKPKSKTVYGNKREAEQQKAELQAIYGPVDAKPGSDLTVACCWTRYYHPYIVRHNAPSTVDGYESAYKTHIKDIFGVRVMESLRPVEVQGWLDTMSYGAARRSYAVLRAMFNWASNMDLIGTNPLRKRYCLPKNSDDVSRVANDNVHDADTLKAIYKECHGQFWESGYICSSFGGLRRSEACAVTPGGVTYYAPGSLEGVNFGFAVVEVNYSVQRIKGEILVSSVLKTENSKGVAVVPDPYGARLAEIAREHKDDKWLMDDGFGSPIDPELAAAAYKRWIICSPHPYIPWKNLRKSYGTMLHESGVDLGLVSKMLRHTSPIITYQHYDKPSIKSLATAASKIS